jgi:Uma2 family endonuclease
VFLIDTMVLSELRRRERDPGGVVWIGQQRQEDCFLSGVSMGEIERGIARRRASDPGFAAELAAWLDQLLRLHPNRLLPDGSVLSPDAALVLEQRWQGLSPEQRRGFPPLCPDLVIELASPSDTGARGITALRRKMHLYQANGARLGWLLLPQERAVEIWRGGQEGMAERLENASRLDGSELAEELALDLEEIWAV